MMHYPKQLTRASKLLAVVVLLYVLLPLTMVVLLSFSTTMKIGAGDFTFRWYLMKMDTILQSLRVSLLVAVLAVVCGLAVTFPLSFAVARRDFPGKKIVDQLIVLPILIPGVVFGMLLLQLFQTRMFQGLHPLAALAIAHTIIVIPLMARPLIAALQQINPSVEEAAQSLGANPIKTFFSVTLPLVAPATLVAVILALARSLNDFIVTLFLINPDYVPLSIQVYKTTLYGMPQLTSAIAVVLLLFSLGLVFIAEKFIEVESLN